MDEVQAAMLPTCISKSASDHLAHHSQLWKCIRNYHALLQLLQGHTGSGNSEDANPTWNPNWNMLAARHTAQTSHRRSPSRCAKAAAAAAARATASGPTSAVPDSRPLKQAALCEDGAESSSSAASSKGRLRAGWIGLLECEASGGREAM